MKSRLLLIIALASFSLAIALPGYACPSVEVRQNMVVVRVLAGEHTKYYIREDIDLYGNTVRIGKGSTLVFRGGSFSNGTVVGNETRVDASNYEIFKRGYTRYRAYVKAGQPETAHPSLKREYHHSIIIGGTWENNTCKSNWTGLLNDSHEDVMLAVRNYILLHKPGVKVAMPAINALGYESTRIPGNHYIDFNGSTISYPENLSIWEDKTMTLPEGARHRSLESGYGLFSMEDNTTISNLTIDGKASYRQDEILRLGVSCLISVGNANNVTFEKVTVVNALGPGMTAQAGAKDLTFQKCIFRNIGEHIMYSHQYKGYCHFVGCIFDTWDSERLSVYREGKDYVYKHSPQRNVEGVTIDDLYSFELTFVNCTFNNPRRVNSQGRILGGFVTGDFPVAVKLDNCTFIGEQPVLNPGGGPNVSEEAGKNWKMIVRRCNGAPSVYPSRANYNIVTEFYDCVNIPFRTVYARRYERCTMYYDVYEDNIENVSPSYEREFSEPLIVKDCVFMDRGEETVINHPLFHRPIEYVNCRFDSNSHRAKVLDRLTVRKK